MKDKIKLDSFGYAGTILNIIFASLIEVATIIKFLDYILYFDEEIMYIILVTLIHLFVGLLALYSIIFNTKILKGNIKERATAIILGFLTLSILGSIFLLISKEKTNLDVKENKTLNIEIDYSQLAKEIEKFKALYDSGAINEEEYTTIKQKLFNI